MAAPSGGLTWPAALRGALRRRSLAQSVTAALTVGSILFVANLLGPLRAGPVTGVLVLRIVLTFVVPWLNATLGIAIGLRRAEAVPLVDRPS